MQRARALVVIDEVGEVVRQPLDAVWVALEDDDELEQHGPFLVLHVRRRGR
jgi:hypothetical protein